MRADNYDVLLLAPRDILLAAWPNALPVEAPLVPQAMPVVPLTVSPVVPPLVPPSCTAQVADPCEKIGNWNEGYWLLRAEPIPADEEQMDEGDLVIRVAHIAGVTGCDGV